MTAPSVARTGRAHQVASANSCGDWPQISGSTRSTLASGETEAVGGSSSQPDHPALMQPNAALQRHRRCRRSPEAGTVVTVVTGRPHIPLILPKRVFRHRTTRTATRQRCGRDVPGQSREALGATRGRRAAQFPSRGNRNKKSRTVTAVTTVTQTASAPRFGTGPGQGMPVRVGPHGPKGGTGRPARPGGPPAPPQGGPRPGLFPNGPQGGLKWRETSRYCSETP